MKKLTALQILENNLDDAWSLLVKLKAGGKCEVQKCRYGPTLNSHHIFSRIKKSTRWNTDNGLCLCVSHHIGSGFSAHKTPTTFTLWLIKYRGEQWHDLLTFKSNQISKLHIFEKQIILKELQNEIKRHENKIQN